MIKGSSVPKEVLLETTAVFIEPLKVPLTGRTEEPLRVLTFLYSGIQRGTLSSCTSVPATSSLQTFTIRRRDLSVTVKGAWLVCLSVT